MVSMAEMRGEQVVYESASIQLGGDQLADLAVRVVSPTICAYQGCPILLFEARPSGRPAIVLHTNGSRMGIDTSPLSEDPQQRVRIAIFTEEGRAQTYRWNEAAYDEE